MKKGHLEITKKGGKKREGGLELRQRRKTWEVQRKGKQKVIQIPSGNWFFSTPLFLHCWCLCPPQRLAVLSGRMRGKNVQNALWRMHVHLLSKCACIRKQKECFHQLNFNTELQGSRKKFLFFFWLCSVCLLHCSTPAAIDPDWDYSNEDRLHPSGGMVCVSARVCVCQGTVGVGRQWGAPLSSTPHSKHFSPKSQSHIT